MATVTRTPARETVSGLRPYRLTVRQFEAMGRAGILTEEDRVELLGGILAEQMTKHPPHDFTVGRSAKLLSDRFGPDRVVREEKAVVLGRNWLPEPDIAVARGPDDRYRAGQPSARDLALVVEVDESTYDTDRGVKWRGYAAARVPVYWIVNLKARAVEVYTDPAGRGPSARYRGAATYGPGDEVPVVVGGREVGRIAVNELLP